MTDEMAVQAQRPSAVPYVLGGAAVGGVGGHLLKNYGIKQQRYGSWDEILKEKEDVFKKEIDATKEKAELNEIWKLGQEHAQIYQEAENEVNNKLTELMNSEHAKYDPKLAGEEVVKTFETARNELYKAGESLANKQGEITEAIKTAIKDGKISGVKVADDISEADLTKKAEEVFKNHKKWKDVEGLNEQFETIFGKDGLQKQVETKKTALDTAKKALEDKAKELGVSAEKQLTEEGKAQKAEIEKGLAKVKAEAEKALKDKVGKLKIGHKWANAAIGAVALGTLALLLRPKAKEQAEV